MARSSSRTNLFDPSSKELFRISRSKLQLFLDCPRCFVLDRRHGIARPDGPLPSINITVDTLMKREFDDYRASHTPHPAMIVAGIVAVPCAHPELHLWRDNFKGIAYAHKSGFIVHGAIDDLWQSPDGTYVLAEYKALSTEAPPSTEWLPDYHRRQMEVYQWLLRKNGLDIAARGYFVFANADKAQPALQNSLQFSLNILPHAGSDEWVEDALMEVRECLMNEALPTPAVDCAWCAYRADATKIL